MATFFAFDFFSILLVLFDVFLVLRFLLAPPGRSQFRVGHPPTQVVEHASGLLGNRLIGQKRQIDLRPFGEVLEQVKRAYPIAAVGRIGYAVG